MNIPNSPPWSTRGGPQDIFLRPDTNWPYPVIVAGNGIWLEDEEGNRYLDVSSGPVASNLGHAHPGVTAAMHSQVDRLTFASSRVARTMENIAFAERLTKLAGPGFERAFLVSGGSEAIDAAIKFSRVHAVRCGQEARQCLISLIPSYHGGTLGCVAVSGDLAQAGMFEGMITLSEKLRAPLSYRPANGRSAEEDEASVLSDLDALIKRIGPDRLLALVLEPVGGLATGANVLSDRFLAGVHSRIRSAGGLVIHDEVMSGGGRTGTFLTCHRKSVPVPDIAVLAKGLGAGYAPLGIMMVSAEATDRVLAGGGFTFGHTAAANPISCAVGMAVLDALERDDLMAKAALRGQQLRDGLERLMARHPTIGDVRGRGLLMAVELVADRAAKIPFPLAFDTATHIRRIGLSEGLTIYARRTNNSNFGEWFMLAPPLTITEAETEDLLFRLDRTLFRFENQAMENSL